MKNIAALLFLGWLIIPKSRGINGLPKSKVCSKVLQLMDENYSYEAALNKVLADNPNIDRKKLEKELELYI